MDKTEYYMMRMYLDLLYTNKDVTFTEFYNTLININRKYGILVATKKD